MKKKDDRLLVSLVFRRSTLKVLHKVTFELCKKKEIKHDTKSYKKLGGRYTELKKICLVDDYFMKLSLTKCSFVVI